CARMGGCGEYIDAGLFAAKERRRALDRLLAACRRREVDAVAVYRYDPFARSLRQLGNGLEEFRTPGNRFRELARRSGQLDLRTAAGVRHLRLDRRVREGADQGSRAVRAGTRK